MKSNQLRGAQRLTLVLLILSTLLAGCAQKAVKTTPTPTGTPRPTLTSEPAAGNTAAPGASPSSTTAAEPAATSTPTATPTAAVIPGQPVRLRSPEYGMQAFLWFHPEVGTRDVQLVKQAGFGWVKLGVGWRDVEPSKGSFIWTQLDDVAKWMVEQQLSLIVRLDQQPDWANPAAAGTNSPPTNYEDFGDFCYALASRYKGRFRAYEIWNEPNLSREWGGRRPNPAEYVALLKVAYRRIKQADPNAIVVSAGLTPTATDDATAMPDDAYLEGMYQAMGNSSNGYFDALGAHAPGYKAPPEMSPAEVAAASDYGGNRFMCFRRIEDLRAIMVKHGDGNKQIWILEFGWTSDTIHPEYAWHAVTENQKADYLVRAYQYAKANWSPWIGLMSVIYIVNPDWTEKDEQYWWALTYPSWPKLKARPAYKALKAMPK